MFSTVTRNIISSNSTSFSTRVLTNKEYTKTVKKGSFTSVYKIVKTYDLYGNCFIKSTLVSIEQSKPIIIQ